MNIYQWSLSINQWFLNNSKMYKWFVYEVCGVLVPQILAVVVYFGIKVKLVGKTIFSVLFSDEITWEVVVKNVGVCLLIGIGFFIWLILELLFLIYGCIPNPDKIHGRCS
jgi:hypothetical protein